MTERLFARLKVIDCASWIAGSAAATILADFGADVIKIEPPGAGDQWRASAPIPVSSPFHLDGEERRCRSARSSVGQHSEEVLEEAGYSRGDIGRLRSLGVLG